MSKKRVLRYEVPVDGESHLIPTEWYHVVHVDTRNPEIVEIWAEDIEGETHKGVCVQVFGTGHEIPITALHLGSVVTDSGNLVWHLYEVKELVK